MTAGIFENIARYHPMHSGRVGTKINVRGIVWHFTAMHHGTENVLAKVWQASKGKGNGATFIVGSDGKIIQLCSIYHNANHAGGASTGRIYFPNDPKSAVLNRTIPHHPNSTLIGVELSNPGRVRKHVGGWKIAYSESPKFVDPLLVVTDKSMGSHTKRADWGWHKYTPEQVTAARSIVLACYAEGITDEPCMIKRQTIKGKKYGVTETGSMRTGHEDFDPSRKSDPGPLWNPRDVVLPTDTSLYV